MNEDGLTFKNIVNLKLSENFNETTPEYWDSDLYKLTPLDIRVGLHVKTLKGEGCIESFDIRTEKVIIAINFDVRQCEEFHLHEIRLLFLSIKPSVMQELGEIMIFFSHIEHVMKIFLQGVLRLDTLSKKVLLLNNFQLSKLKDIINDIINQTFEKGSREHSYWKEISHTLLSLNVKRNNIVHGDFIRNNDSYIFHNPRQFYNLKPNENEVMDFNKLEAIKNDSSNLYYTLWMFLRSIEEECRTKMDKLE